MMGMGIPERRLQVYLHTPDPAGALEDHLCALKVRTLRREKPGADDLYGLPGEGAQRSRFVQAMLPYPVQE